MEKGEDIKSAADAICKAKYSERKKSPKRAALKYPDTLAENEAAARELDLSYGVYMGYCESGYIDTYRKMHRNQQKRAGKRKRRENVIESGIIGTASGFHKVIEAGPSLLPSTRYVYFDTSGRNGRNHVRYGGHLYGME